MNRTNYSNMLNGILSSINTLDSVTLGYSYFYSEVLRVKKAAQFVRDTPRVLLIMDELFKGTNIKDAYDGSLMVIKGLAQNPGCLVVISSHLLELAEDLKPLPTVSFSCFSSTLVDGKPRFDYRIHVRVSFRCELNIWVEEKSFCFSRFMLIPLSRPSKMFTVSEASRVLR